MGASQRAKGASAEREVAHLLGYQRNARNGLEAGDLLVPDHCPYSFEVKRRGRAFGTVYAALDQAAGYRAGTIPVALIRDDRREWLAVFRLEDARPWLTSAGETGCEACCGDCARGRESAAGGCASVADGKLNQDSKSTTTER